MNGPGDLNMPFERNPQPFDMTLDASSLIASGVVVVAAAAPVAGMGTLPCLVFRFAKPDGSGFYPAMALICTADQLAGITAVVGDATAAAIEAAVGGGNGG